jgi:hypothetical protein
MEESIYNLIPQTQPLLVRPAMHHSMHAGTVNPKDMTFGGKVTKSAATFGYPNGTNALVTSQYTLKHSKEPCLPDPAPPTMPKTKMKALVPAKDDVPIMGLSSGKDFIKTNAVAAILSQPKKGEEDFLWTQRKGFGETPMYMKRVKQQVAEEKSYMEQFMRMRGAPDVGKKVSQLSEHERSELIRHLKLKWGSMNTAYQKGSISVDSAIKKMRKEDLERSLAEIERDIKTLERGEVILIVDE